MNHEQAIREQAVERYLLGELADDARASFEEHYFDCAICAADLKDSTTFIDALRDMPQPVPSPQTTVHLVPKVVRRRTAAAWLAPALAASLLVVAYQNVLVLPGMRHAVAIAQVPAVMNNLVLANIDARGADIPKLSAPAHGSFLISVDVPSKAEYASYLCTLYASTGEQLWQLPITSQQAENTVSVRVPTDKAAAGVNELRIQGLAAGGPPVEVGRYRFTLQISR